MDFIVKKLAQDLDLTLKMWKNGAELCWTRERQLTIP